LSTSSGVKRLKISRLVSRTTCMGAAYKQPSGYSRLQLEGMARVIVNAAMSLDGYIAGPRHEMDWIFDHPFLPDAPIHLIDDVIASTGAILSGRGSYEVGQTSTRQETSSAFGGGWSGPEFVLTHRPPSQPPRADLQFLSGDIADAVGIASRAADGKDLLVLGANVAQQCFEADLVDEVLLIVLPILLGNGIRLFGQSTFRESLFETVKVEQVGQAVVLHYRRQR
jgi:dihydrofolate reductase